MSITKQIEKYSDLDLLAAEDRYTLGLFLRAAVDGAWTHLITTVTPNYVALIAACLLWVAPQNGEVEQRSRIRLFINLATSVVAASVTFGASAKLDEHQEDLDDAADVKRFRKGAQLDLEKTELDDQAYVAKVNARYQLNSQLPEAHRHPYLISAEEADKERKSPVPEGKKGKLAFMQSMGLANHPEAQQFLGDEIGKDETEVDEPFKKSDFFYKTIRNERKRCIRVGNRKKYCGLPITDVSQWVARDNYSLLLIGPSGAGKTLLLEHCIKQAQAHSSLVDMFGVTHKGRNIAAGEKLHYAGLENCKDFLEYSSTDPNEYRFANNGYELRRLTIRLLGALHEGSTHPTIALIDEINNGHKAVKRLTRIIKSQWEADKASAGKGERPPRPELLDIADEYAEATSFAFTQGQSKNFRLWMIAHDNTNGALQMPHGEKLSARYLALTRDGQDAAFLRTFQDDRFIPDADIRAGLKEQYTAFKQAHKKYGSPANIVVCVTNVGGKDWRLVVLPQYEQVEPIDFNAVNPHVDDLDGDGKPDFEVLDEPVTENTAEPVEELSVEAMPEETVADKVLPQIDQDMISSLEASLSAAQPEDQRQRAEALIQWLRYDETGVSYVRPNGAIDPYVIQNIYPHVSTVEQLEYLLEIAEQMGIGYFCNEELTGIKLWQFAENLFTSKERDRASAVIAPSKDRAPGASTAIDVNALNTAEEIIERGVRPAWMTDEVIDYVMERISKDSDTVRWRSVRVLWKSTKYHKQNQRNSDTDVSKEQFLLILKTLSHREIGFIHFDSGNEDSFRYLGE